MKIYIVYSNSFSKVSMLLRLLLRNEYTHVSIALEEDMFQFYSFARKYLHMPLIGGFVEEHPDRGNMAAFKRTITEVFELEVNEEEYRKIKTLISIHQKLSSRYHYNFRGIPFMWLNIPYERNNYYVCSQYVGYLLQESGIHDFNKSWSLIRPCDLREITEMKSIYKGTMNKYMETMSKNKKLRGGYIG